MKIGVLSDTHANLENTKKAVEITNETLARVRAAMRINYFDDRAIVKEWEMLLLYLNNALLLMKKHQEMLLMN